MVRGAVSCVQLGSEGNYSPYSGDNNALEPRDLLFKSVQNDSPEGTYLEVGGQAQDPSSFSVLLE